MDHECVDACALDRRRAARMGARLDAHIVGAPGAARLYRALARALERTACPRARAELRWEIELCACLVPAPLPKRTGRALA